MSCVHHEPAILDAGDARHLGDAGLGVDLDLRELHATRARGGQPLLPFAVHRHGLGPEQLARLLPRQPFRRVALRLHAAVARGDVGGRHAELRRDAFRQRLDGLGGRHANRRRHRGRRRAAAAPAAERVVRVADLHGHRADGESQGLGGDDGDQCLGPDAQVLCPALHDDASVRVDRAVRLRPAAATAPPVRRAAHPPLDRPGRRVLGRVPLLPPELLGGQRKVGPPHGIRRLGREVLQTEGQRVHPHLVRELVHQHFGDEAALRMPGRAHGTLLARVDVDILVDAAPVREHVDVGQRESRARAGATGAPALRVERGERAVGRDTCTDPGGRRGTIAARKMLLLAVEHQLHRRLRLPGQLRADDSLHVGPELAAEPAAHELRDDPDVRLRDVQRLGEPLARAVHRLRGDPRGQRVALPLADVGTGKSWQSNCLQRLSCSAG